MYENLEYKNEYPLSIGIAVQFHCTKICISINKLSNYAENYAKLLVLLVQ